MRGSHVIGLATLLAVGAQALAAQQQARQVTPVFGFTVGAMAIDAAAATEAQVGDRSFGIQLDAGALFDRHLYLGIDVGGQFLDDKAEFTQNTTVGERESTASVTYFSVIAGARSGTPRKLPVAVGLSLGASVTSPRRSIDECVDCRVDKLKIPGGAFVEPMLLLGRRNARARMTNRFYVSGNGMRNVISVGIDYQYQKK